MKITTHQPERDGKNQKLIFVNIKKWKNQNTTTDLNLFFSQDYQTEPKINFNCSLPERILRFLSRRWKKLPS